MRNTHGERPEWLVEPCPKWCHGDHSGQELPADRNHLSDQVLVPVITKGRAPSWRRIPGDLVAADDLTIAISQRVGDREAWLAIVNDTQNVEVSLESVARLSAALAAVIDEVTTGAA